MFRLRAAAKGLQFQVTITAGPVDSVIADASKIRQVLINMLGNAIKFTDRGQITLEVVLSQRTDQRLWLIAEVADTGVGIPPEEQRKLFEPFSQLQGGLNIHGGTGLGLAISRKYARLMGGDLTARNNPAGGSVFQFTIPTDVDDSGTLVKLEEPRRVIGLRNGQVPPRVLVVDDQPDNRAWLSKLLCSIGFNVREAVNGKIATNVWEGWRPQIILMDLNMPEMDGWEAIRRIRAHPAGRETTIIALTASALEDDRKFALQTGADGFVTKPCRDDELLETMRGFLRIEYEYDETARPQPPPVASSAAVDPERLGRLPQDFINSLRSAVLSGNKNKLDQLLLAVHQSGDTQSAQALQQLADNYDYDGLNRVLQAATELDKEHIAALP
jgi:two-component system sensor histidine kinase/response regulator